MMQQEEKWVSTWGNAISVADRKPENYAKNLTLRYPIKPMFDGTAIRLTLDNFCGTEDVVVTKVTLATTMTAEKLQSRDDESAANAHIKKDPCRMIQQETLAFVTFGGNQDVRLPKGEAIVSDAITFEVKRGQDISVSIFLGGFTEMRSGVVITGPLSKGYYSVGDYTEEEELPLDLTRNTNMFYFLSDIDVLTKENARAVICFGDSITSQAWPDELTLRVLNDIDKPEKSENTKKLDKTDTPRYTSIIRKAASGTRILRQYDNITYDSYGIKGETRFPRECKVSGADTVIIQHGINDIIHPVGVDVNPFRPWSDLPTVEEMIEGLRKYIRWAREYGLKVYMGTLLPIYGWRTYEPFRDELRCKVNEWIRTTDEIDGCIDFDMAVRNEQKPEAFAEGCDSGDHLHPSLLAYQKMAMAVPDEIL